MTIVLGLPRTPVVVVPGTEARVPVEVTNEGIDDVEVRLALARGRASAWVRADPERVELPSGERTSVELVFSPPKSLAISRGLQPFTVLAQESGTAAVAGRATGLLSVNAPQHLSATLTNGKRWRNPVTLEVTNSGENAMTVLVEPRLDPDAGKVSVKPTVLDVQPGTPATALIKARPKRKLSGPATKYALVVDLSDIADEADDAPPVVSTEIDRMNKSRLGRRTPTVLAIVLIVAMTAGAVVFFEWKPRLPSFFGGGSGNATAPTSAPKPVEPQVRRPYVLIDVFPQTGPDRGKPEADAALAALKAAGMSPKLIDASGGVVIAGRQGQLWVILQDGFASIEEARGYCDQFRPVAPKCEAVP
ncbi:hypothetical protein Val02_01140 [Virgisporangium aliadipatigenens]|uniref:SPOR domain-containing protein n=1 Tax=Virgisporangium aliadipatigenens TaxID=741659 RepID=A0A8J4DN58_9ACTN|nr:hypothetical protein [Virgisporangium aliadipatigenens]GIJ43228.1 hypothetical protein Val02_01140 [Virgisporangium aliadipatigenens]